MIPTPLAALVTVSAGQSAPKDSEFSKSGTPFVRAGSLEALLGGKNEAELELVSDEVAKQRKLKLYPKGTVLFAKSGMSATKDRVYVLRHPAYVVSHLATLVPKADTHTEYLRLVLKAFPPSRLIKDFAYPAISLGDIESFEIPVPEVFDDQIRIAHLLGKVERLIAQRKQQLQQLDDLLKSVFLEMFGDPLRNEKGWDKPPLRAFGKISTGNTPPRNDASNYGGQYIEWIKTDNIGADAVFVSTATEYLSESGARRARTVSKGSLLVACIAGSVESIGRAALTDRKVAFNQQINAIQPAADVSPLFLYGLFKLSRSYIQSHASKGMKKILTKGDFEQITMIKPPFELQQEFSQVAERIEPMKAGYQQSLTDLEALYGVLSQKAFKGELDLSRIPLPDAEPLEPRTTMPAAGPSPADPQYPINLPDTELLLAVLDDRTRLKELLPFWLEAYRVQLNGAIFSAQDFLAAAQTRIAELHPDNDFELGAEAYEQVKIWVFDRVKSRELKQTRNIVSTGVKRKFGNEVLIRARRPRF